MAKKVNDYWKDFKNKVSESEDIFKSIYNDLNTNPKYQDYFNQYHPDSVIRFKENFARYKTNCIVHEKYYRDKEEELIHQHIDTATKCLWEIQHFKLLLAEGKWRANQLELDGIEYTYQFMYWHVHIEECNFIDPISDSDIETYINYLKQDESEHTFWLDYMHNIDPFERLVYSHKINKEMPPYVDYMMKLYGKQIIFVDDIKGEQEEKYKAAAREENKKNADEKMINDPGDTRPVLHFSQQEHFEDIIARFGEPRMLDYRKVEYELMQFYGGWGYFEDSCELLQEAGDDFPIGYHEDWHQAIINAANKYKRENVIKAIKTAYKDYQFRLKNGIAFTKYDGHRSDDETYDWYSKMSLDHINHGKRILGEK